jgi:hypothetical protein
MASFSVLELAGSLLFGTASGNGTPASIIFQWHADASKGAIYRMHQWSSVLWIFFNFSSFKNLAKRVKCVLLLLWRCHRYIQASWTSASIFRQYFPCAFRRWSVITSKNVIDHENLRHSCISRSVNSLLSQTLLNCAAVMSTV